eukprot:51228-Eustigmatos_ZCMA.PRE.1
MHRTPPLSSCDALDAELARALGQSVDSQHRRTPQPKTICDMNAMSKMHRYICLVICGALLQ